MSKITPDEVRRVAELANMGLQEAEVSKLADELAKIVGFVEQLQEVDVEGVEPTDQVTGLVDVWREDEVREGLSYDDLKLNAPDFEDGQYRVKRVLNND
ncbi:MAG TPA: Asp-tRNA(Asn)/Glu-tRNA(Gln) amidotransferase subunit GatC [Candidatus Saccharimonadales bacterium]|nr:Asp-tRNA(Asn)/Glu-tRNA(Gln) amidotransferase subunit GatC [Candidatus Saccharimonadales bacterium]